MKTKKSVVGVSLEDEKILIFKRKALERGFKSLSAYIAAILDIAYEAEIALESKTKVETMTEAKAVNEGETVSKVAPKAIPEVVPEVETKVKTVIEAIPQIEVEVLSNEEREEKINQFYKVCNIKNFDQNEKDKIRQIFNQCPDWREAHGDLIIGMNYLGYLLNEFPNTDNATQKDWRLQLLRLNPGIEYNKIRETEYNKIREERKKI